MVTLDHQIDWADHEPAGEEASTSSQVNLLAFTPSEDKKEQVSLMGISQVTNCVFGCSVRYNELKQEFDELKPKYNECYVEVESYKMALKTLEKQKVWFQKNQVKYDEKVRVLESDLEVAKIELKRTEKEKSDLEK